MKPKAKLAIVGQGYVGLPLAMLAVEAGYSVIGIENDQTKLLSLERCKSYIEDVSDTTLTNAIESGNYSFTDDYRSVSEVEILIFCLPTPIDANKLPDLNILLSALNSCKSYLPQDILVISESTSYPGTLRNVIARALLESNPKASNILFAVAPERVDPANSNFDHLDIPRLVAGLTEEATKKAQAFYESLGLVILTVSSPEVAEAAKLLENTFRQVNIAMINEFAKISSAIGIDVREVIDAAATKPYGFMKFNPGPGVGGHCIPVDPHYLTWASRQFGFEPTLIELANEINSSMPHYVTEKFKNLFENDLYEKKILVAGLAYKSGVSDTRESPAVEILEIFKSSGANVSWHDPLVRVFAGQNSDELDKIFDGVIITLPKLNLPIDFWVKSGTKVFDCTGFYREFSGVIQL